MLASWIGSWAHFENLDNETDGLLIHGENFQGLNLLKEKYRESVKAIYIDPTLQYQGIWLSV